LSRRRSSYEYGSEDELKFGGSARKSSRRRDLKFARRNSRILSAVTLNQIQKSGRSSKQLWAQTISNPNDRARRSGNQNRRLALRKLSRPTAAEAPKKGTMERSDNTPDRENKATQTPFALIIFVSGFEALPLIVPNGGSVEIDEEIRRWLTRRLLTGEQSRKAA
jgi:hypothetical protein